MKDSTLALKEFLPTAANSIPSPFFKNYLAWSTFALGGVLSCGLVFRYGVNVFFLDEWDIAYGFFHSLYEQNQFWKPLWEQHNEHRVIGVKLSYYILYFLALVWLVV